MSDARSHLWKFKTWNFIYKGLIVFHLGQKQKCPCYSKITNLPSSGLEHVISGMVGFNTTPSQNTSSASSLKSNLVFLRSQLQIRTLWHCLFSSFFMSVGFYGMFWPSQFDAVSQICKNTIFMLPSNYATCITDPRVRLRDGVRLKNRVRLSDKVRAPAWNRTWQLNKQGVPWPSSG